MSDKIKAYHLDPQGASGPWQPEKSGVLPATAGTGSSSLRCAGWSTPCWWIRRRSMRRVQAPWGTQAMRPLSRVREIA
jgi:hypothetical protein